MKLGNEIQIIEVFSLWASVDSTCNCKKTENMNFLLRIFFFIYICSENIRWDTMM